MNSFGIILALTPLLFAENKECANADTQWHGILEVDSIQKCAAYCKSKYSNVPKVFEYQYLGSLCGCTGTRNIKLDGTCELQDVALRNVYKYGKIILKKHKH